MQRFLELVAFLALMMGIVFLVLSIVHWFDAAYFFGMFFCFVVAWIIWPEKTRRSRDKRESYNDFWDIFDLILELPFSFFLWVFRAIAAFFRGLARLLDF